MPSTGLSVRGENSPSPSSSVLTAPKRPRGGLCGTRNSPAMSSRFPERLSLTGGAHARPGGRAWLPLRRPITNPSRCARRSMPTMPLTVRLPPMTSIAPSRMGAATGAHSRGVVTTNSTRWSLHARLISGHGSLAWIHGGVVPPFNPMPRPDELNPQLRRAFLARHGFGDRDPPVRLRSRSDRR